MIIIHVMGGLGNQLYQYALYEKMKSLGKEVKLDLYAYQPDTCEEDKEWRDLELGWLDRLEFDVCTRQERAALLDNSMKLKDRIHRKLHGRQDKTVRETKEYMPEIFDMDQVYLYGFWGCERYYVDILPLLRQKIRFSQSTDIRIAMKNADLMKQMQQEQSVSIHLRRKDYLTVADGKRYMGICTDAYYEAAMQYIREHVEHPVFYIFSDDVAYAKEHYQGENMHIVDWNTGKNSMYDMQLMSCCKHNICANSTFSMWGARLNANPDKWMIRPLKHDNYETITTDQMHENWPGWILIDAEGKIC